jgi:hypothetical protein
MEQVMKRVLCSIFLSSAFLSTVAGAATLECGSDSLEKFTVDLDSSGYRQRDTLLFWARDAHIRVGYATAEQMTCAGHTLGDLHCVGFWFGVQDHVAQVRMRKTADGYVAFFNWPDKSELDMNLKPCVVK